MGQALDSFILEGVTTTIPFLARVIRHPDFVAGDGGHQVPRARAAAAETRGMKLDVVFSPLGLLPGQATGRTIFVIDILRASTVICAALHHGARAVLPRRHHRGGAAARADHRRARRAPAAGSAAACPIPGFALGNSPLEMTPDAVRGRTLVMTTTNGTPALLAAQGAASVYLAAAANLTAAVAARPRRARRPGRPR